MRLVALLVIVLAGTVLNLLLQEAQPVPPTGTSSIDGPTADAAEKPPEAMLARVPLESDHRFMDEARQVLEVRHKTTILEAVTRMDPTGTTDLRAVTLIRKEPAPITVFVDVRSMILTGDTTYNLMLRPGDVLWLQ